jgi:thiosulfate/3-mercaptopyruvate sulfurtransferase
MTPTDGYINPDLLCETQWLAERMNRRDLRIVDMGPYEGYARAHIPGAVHVGPGDRSHYLKDPDDPLHVLPPDAFAGLVSRLGIGNDTLVVAYDADGGHTAARLWWALDYYGHPRCKVLNGGFNKWVLEKRPVQIEQPLYPRAKFRPRVREDVLCTVDTLRDELLDRDDVVLWDVRSPAEHEGTETRGNKRTGHIPGAKHLEWRELVTADAARTFKPAAEMRQLLWERGITPNKLVVTY